jgi:hypothetical protein
MWRGQKNNLVRGAGKPVTLKQLIRKLLHPPCKRITAVRIEFADGGIYQVSPVMRQSASCRKQKKEADLTKAWGRDTFLISQAGGTRENSPP